MGGFSVNTNIASLQAREYIRVNSDLQQKTIGRVTSGLRITASGDDAAGLAIANGYRSDVSVLTQGIRNANDGLSQLQIVDGGLNNISKLIDRARTLATQSASGTFTGSRAVLNSEFSSVLTEIDRQAQAIGLNIGGTFAKSLAVFIGGGAGTTDSAKITNGSVAVDLSTSTVDTRSLGLSGLQAAGVSGSDISTSSSTSVANIVADANNTGAVANAGFTDFYFKGPGFSDADKVKVSVNLAGVTNTTNLASAINAAIDGAGNGSSQAATAFKNAGVRAIVVQDKQADGTVKERLGFTSSTTAFQVQAGDRLANALMGNFISSGSTTGDTLQTSVVGGSAAASAGTTGSSAGNIIVRFQGGGLSGPVDIRLSVTGGSTTVGQILTSLTSQVANNSALQAAGISVTNATAGEYMVFQSSTGQRFEVLTAGDTTNVLGLGTYGLANQSTATSMDYTAITSSANAFAADGSIRLEFSVNGNATLIDTGSLSFAGGSAAARQAAALLALNNYFAGSSAAQAAGLQAVDAGSNAITIQSSNGTAFRINTRAAGTIGDLNFNNGSTAAAITSNLANSFRGNAAQTSGTAATGETLVLNVNGTDTSVTISNGDNAATMVTSIATALGSNGTAVTRNSRTVINVAEGSKVYVKSGSANVLTVLGLSVGDTNQPDKAAFNAGGAYGTELGTNKDVFNYTQFRNGKDSQTVNIVANDTTGAQRSLAVTLRNDSIARNARSLDEALNTINDALQNSGDETLKKIVAVKETTYNGREDGIRFVSTLSNFRVSIGAVSGSTASSEVGIYDGSTGSSILGQGALTAATQTAGGAQTDIATQANAQAAVTALAKAVEYLGASQAVVGRGQNQFNFAVNLAQSQVVNLAAAESRIRDADLASEAANLTKAQIVLQAGIAALAQANSAPQAVLALLRG